MKKFCSLALAAIIFNIACIDDEAPFEFSPEYEVLLTQVENTCGGLQAFSLDANLRMYSKAETFFVIFAPVKLDSTTFAGSAISDNFDVDFTQPQRKGSAGTIHNRLMGFNFAGAFSAQSGLVVAEIFPAKSGAAPSVELLMQVSYGADECVILMTGTPTEK